MSDNKYPVSYFKEKYYIREDLFPEPFDVVKRGIHNCNIMKQLGNCFDSKDQALQKCNAIRILLSVPTI